MWGFAAVNTIPNPDNWMDVVTILIATAIVALPSWFAARNHKGIQEVKAQVVNGHTQPLRADLDRVIASIDNLTADVRDLREELTVEANMRRSQIKDLRDDVDHRLHYRNQ